LDTAALRGPFSRTLFLKILH